MMLPSTYRQFSVCSLTSEAFTTFGCSTSWSHTLAKQPGRRRGVARVTADGAVDARRDQHHGVERVGPGQPALPVVEHVGFGVVRAVNLRLNRFDFALMAARVLPVTATRSGVASRAEGGIGRVLQGRERRTAIEQLTNVELLGRNFHPMQSS